MKPTRVFSVYVGVYRCSVSVFCGTSLEDIVDYGIRCGLPAESLNGRWEKAIEKTIKEKNVGAFCDWYGKHSRNIIIWVTHRPKTTTDFGVLYHELYHAVDMIAKDVDFDKRLGDEGRAYLFQYLADECNKRLCRKGGRIWDE